MTSMSSHHPAAAAALAAFLLVSSTLLAPTQAACTPGKTPEHCKPKGAACTPRKVSECEDPYKCDKVSRTCTDPTGGQTELNPQPLPPTTDTGSCVLPVSPFKVNTGTPADHVRRHPGDTNYKNIAAVDMVTAAAGQEVYAVESGKLSSGGSFAISSGPDKWGWSFEILTPNKGNFFYTHVADPLAKNPATGKPWGPGEEVQKGQLLGWVAQPPPPEPPRQTAHAIHLHFAYQTPARTPGNPCDYLRGCKGINGAAPDATLSKC